MLCFFKRIDKNNLRILLSIVLLELFNDMKPYKCLCKSLPISVSGRLVERLWNFNTEFNKIYSERLMITYNSLVYPAIHGNHAIIIYNNIYMRHQRPVYTPRSTRLCIFPRVRKHILNSR